MPEEPANIVLEHLRMIRTEVAEVRAEVAKTLAEVDGLRTITLATLDRSRRVERRIDEIRDDLELMIKAELMGRLGHFETRLERKLDHLIEQLAPAPAFKP